MPHAWKGDLVFGLVTIPVSLESAETGDKLHFHLIDQRDRAPIGYKMINKVTQREVPRGQIIKGYEYSKNRFVSMTNTDFRQANVKATHEIEILSFVDQNEVDPLYFYKPYYVIPHPNAAKRYALFMQALVETGKMGIGTVVIQNRQHPVALMARDRSIVMEMMRFAHELKPGPPVKTVKAAKTSGNTSELKMAEKLIDEMKETWNPARLHDQYQEDLRQFIKRKIKAGKTGVIKQLPEDKIRARSESPEADLIEKPEFMNLIRASLRKAERGHGRTARKAA